MSDASQEPQRGSARGSLKLLTSVGSGPEAEMIRVRLATAGIEAIAQGGAFSARAADLGARDLYVAERDLERAREILGAGEGISEAELVRAEEEDAAARERALLQRGGPAPAPARRGGWRRLFGR